MQNSFVFALYLVVAWPFLWFLLGRKLSPKGLGWSIFVSLASLFGFSAGFIMLSSLVPETVKLTLTPTKLFSTEGIIYGANVTLEPTFWHYLLIAAPWIVIGFVVFRLGFGLFLLSSRTRGYRVAPKSFRESLSRGFDGQDARNTAFFLGKSGSEAFSTLNSVYISENLIKGLSKEQLDAVVAHEMAHIRRRDIINMWLWTLNIALCSYLPGKFAWKDYSLELEKETDRLAVKAIGSPFPLAEALIGVAKLCSPVKVAANLSSGGLEERTMALLEPKKEKLVVHKSLATVLCFTLLLLMPLWPEKTNSLVGMGISEVQAQKMIEGKMVALVKPTGDAGKPYQVNFYPEQAIKIDGFGNLILDKRLVIRKL